MTGKILPAPSNLKAPDRKVLCLIRILRAAAFDCSLVIREHRRRSLPGDSWIILNGVLFSHPLGQWQGTYIWTEQHRPCRLKTASTEFPYFLLCTKATVVSAEDSLIHYHAIRFRNRAVYIARKKKNEGNRCGKDDVEIAREAMTSSSENYTSLLTLQRPTCMIAAFLKKYCKLIIIRMLIISHCPIS